MMPRTRKAATGEKGVTPNLIAIGEGVGALFLERLADELGKVVVPRKRGRPKKDK
jgi:hypothetical protein